MSNDYATMMRNGVKLPEGAKVPRIGEGKAGGGMRLAPYVPDDNGRELVSILAGNGVSQEIMARLLHINVRTLMKHFRREMEEGREMVTAMMGAALVKEGLAGNVAALRYWLGQHGGEQWRIRSADQQSDVFDSEGKRQIVQFYMPSNHRDEAEDLGPVIEGDPVEDAA